MAKKAKAAAKQKRLERGEDDGSNSKMMGNRRTPVNEEIWSGLLTCTVAMTTERWISTRSMKNGLR